MKDCQWLAHLLRHGLLKASFVPERGQRDLRELTRYRVSVVQERTREVNRLQKVLEGANIKLAAVATDITGKSARAMLAALVEGSTDVESMAELAKGRMRTKLPQLRQALTGHFDDHQRFMVAELLAHIDYLDEGLLRATAAIDERMHPFEQAVQQLDAITGVGRDVAQGVIAETGTDMSRFPSERHLSAWAGAAPGNRESAGKRKSGRTRKGNPFLRRLLIQAGHAAGRAKNSYLSAQYHRIAARRGAKRAALAVGHSILVIIYHLLSHPERTYTDLGADYFVRRDPQRAVRHHVKQLMAMGYEVTLATTAA